MTDHGPADELHTAADRLRALATAASTDKRGKPTARWYFSGRDGSGYLYAANPDGPGVRITPGPQGRGTHPGMSTRHGEYAAAMDPTLGLALAELLEYAAQFADLYTDLSRASGIEPTEADHDKAVRHALTVARHINGDSR